MARIPIATDVAELIGPAAEKVENRSLLLDKFAFHKRWPLMTDPEGRDVKWDDATRWSFMRIAEGASQLLNKDALSKRRRANGQGVKPDNRNRLLAEAELAESLARVSWDSKELSSLRSRHTRRFLNLFLRRSGQDVSVTIGQLEARLAINLSDCLIQNAGICLDRLFGLPFIPGSAIKGVCRHTALEEIKTARGDIQGKLFHDFRAVFGTADNDFKNGELRFFRSLLSDGAENQKGAIAFLPAYPVNEARVVVDLTTVHYPRYYGGDRSRGIPAGLTESLAEEKPQPNFFPVVEQGAQFAFCVVLNGVNDDPALLKSATRLLEVALTVRGLGAKTSSGYGWFSLRRDILQDILEQDRREAQLIAVQNTAAAEARAKAAAEAIRQAAMPPEELARDRFAAMNQENFAIAVTGIPDLSAAEQKGLLLALLLPARRETWKSWKKSDKPANKTRIERLLAAAKSLQIILP